MSQAFLCLRRTLRVASPPQSRTTSVLQASRPLTASARRAADTNNKEPKEHTLDKGVKGDPNIQSYESSHGRKNRAQGTGGTATESRDTTGSAAKAKKEHPEAPDTVIGMQDERGGKGH